MESTDIMVSKVHIAFLVWCIETCACYLHVCYCSSGFCVYE